MSKKKTIKTNRELSDEEINANKKATKIRNVFVYIIPLIVAIVLAVLYLIFRSIIILILFAICVGIVLFGWDAGMRTCPKCKKWNIMEWTKIENVVKTENYTVQRLFSKKEKTRVKKEKVRQTTGRCTNCGYEYTREDKKIF